MRVDGRRLHEVEKFAVLIEQRLIVGVKVRRRDSEFVGPSDPGRESVGEVFVCAHHVVACKVECLSRQVRQPLVRIDLRAPLAEDRLEVFHCFVVRIERIRLFCRERTRLAHCRGHEAEIADGGRDERRDRVDDRIDGDGSRRREEESENESCRGRSGVTLYPHGGLPMRKASPDTTHWIVDNERAACETKASIRCNVR